MPPFVVIIPSRWGSQRLPGKPLVDLCGEPMIRRVVNQAAKSSSTRIIVATDSTAVAEVLDHSACETVMTSPDLTSGTDRLAAAAECLSLDPETIVVNLQGDEPLMPPECIDQVAQGLFESAADMATLSCQFNADEDVSDPNSVKVVTDDYGKALYFSRALIPYNRDQMPQDDPPIYQRHVGLYAYRVKFLKAFVGWSTGNLESIEKLEQLRALQHGRTIQVFQATQNIPPGVDTDHDLAQARLHYKGMFQNG